MNLTIVEADPLCRDALFLLREAAREARALYPELHPEGSGWPTNAPRSLRGVYLLACDDGQAVGMGAHRPVDDETTEIRRMYVLPRARRHGVGRVLLRHLEDHARGAGFAAMILETGCRQLPAMKLYESTGFERIPPFGDHVNDPTSVCYRKPVAARA